MKRSVSRARSGRCRGIEKRVGIVATLFDKSYVDVAERSR